jgi:site-specific DNA-methyltransferase (adenine-specific)
MASKRLGRNYIGFELDKSYWDITNKKLEEETFISKLGNSYVSFHLDKVLTLRDKDWEELKDYFIIPRKIEEVDKKEIILKSTGDFFKNKLF